MKTVMLLPDISEGLKQNQTSKLLFNLQRSCPTCSQAYSRFLMIPFLLLNEYIIMLILLYIFFIQHFYFCLKATLADSPETMLCTIVQMLKMIEG